MAANTKDIVLRIEAVTNQDVVESYGKEIDELLGSYDKWIKTVQESTAIIDGLNKKVKEGQTLSDAEIRTLNEEKAKRTEALRLMRQEDKIRTSANGSLKQQQLLLSKVNDAIRKMTAEQKKANPELMKFQKALYDHVKGVNAEMGNFQINVGNYPQLLQQILPVQSQVGQGLMQLAQNAGASTGAIGALGVGLGAAVGAYKLFQQAQELTQTVGDAVAIKMAGWEAVWDKFIRTVVSADFSNFIQGLRDAKNIGEETAAVLDELFERNNALAIAEAKASVEQQRNLKIMRDQTRSIEERKAAGEAYTASVMELAQKRQDIAQQEHDALLANFAAQTGASKAQISWYIENYDKYRSVANQYNADVAAAEEAYKTQQKYIRQLDGAATAQDYADAQELYKKWQAAKDGVSNLSEEEQQFLTIQNKYNLANDEMTTQLVNSWANVYRAISGAESATQRAATTVSSLTAQQQRKTQIDTSKVGLLKEQKTNTKIKADGLFEGFEREADAEWEGFAEVQAGNMVKAAEIAIDDFIEEMEAEPAIVLDRIKQSPFAKALGVTDEQLTSIKSQALQAAQQIYSSIQQAAQQASQRRLNDELKAVETEAEREKAILKAKLDSGVLNEKQYEKKIAEIDKQAEAKREEMQKEAFEREKRWNIATALMNMALAITNIWATNKGGAAARIAETVIATASGLAQIAAISAQKYARGGELHGASHAQGGIKGNIQGHNIELEGDEVVINKRSSRKYRSLLSYINSDNGWGVDFAGVRGRGGYHPQLKYARGGVLGSYDFSPASVPQASLLQKQMERQVEQTESLIAATNRRIDRLQVQVNISDIEGASNTKRVHINRAKL
jgi:hypothetical protein